MKKLYFIINPKAKNGRSLKVWKKIELALAQENIAYQAFFSEYSGHAKSITHSIIQHAAVKPISIVAVGGDGTIHEVINGAANSHDVEIGYIPAGSGNDFWRGFSIPKEPHEALNLVINKINHQVYFVDVGKIIDRRNKVTFFISNMGVGFDAYVAREANQSKMKGLLNHISLGKLVYVYILIKNLIAYTCSNIEVEVDGKNYRFENTWFVTVSNQPFFGGGMKIAPKATPTDGLLNITVVHNLSKLKLLFVFITVFWGGHIRFKEVKTFIGKDIAINTEEPLLVHADGEIVADSPVKIEVCEGVQPIYTQSNL